MIFSSQSSLVDPRVRASNEGSQRPRVARAQKINQAPSHPHSVSKKGIWPLLVILC
jgi:hypothetical protein